MNKINISYLNLAAQSPSIELNFALSEKIYKKSNRTKHLFFMCDSALTSCAVNLLNKKSICRICKSKARRGFQIFNERNPNSELIKISRNDIIANSSKNSFVDNFKDELLLGVNSTIGSQLRIDDMSLLDQRWKKIYSNMYLSSVAMFNYFDNFLESKTVDNFIFFNGRFSCARPLICASKKNKVNYNLFDAALNGKSPLYSVNEMFHSLNFEKNNALKTYVKYYSESQKIADEYIFKKQNAIQTNDFAYTKFQKRGYIDKEVLELKKPLISIFVSSDDEFKFIGSDWAEFGLPDQIKSIYKIINSPLSKEYDFIVKMHPNQRKIHSSIKERYIELNKHVRVLFPENKSDTYSLISYSSIILNFCSTVGAEANYLRKPVIQIGASRYRLLPIANYVKSAKEAIEIINDKKFKLMPKRASTVYFCFHGMSNFKLNSYEYIEDGVYKYGGKFIRASFLNRLYAVPDKLWMHIIRGNKELFQNLNLYIKNLFFGTTKIK